MTHAFTIGDRVRLKGGTDIGIVRTTDRFTTGEPCYFVEPYLSGSGRMYIGESALEPADAPTAPAPAPAGAADGAVAAAGEPVERRASRRSHRDAEHPAKGAAGD